MGTDNQHQTAAQAYIDATGGRAPDHGRNAQIRTLSDEPTFPHPQATTHREGVSAYRLIARSYPSGDAEVTCLQVSSEDQFRKGGGAKRKATAKGEGIDSAADVELLMDEVTLRKSQQRAKTTVRRKLLSFQADRMLTLTFRDNVADLDDAWSCFKYFSKLMRWRYREKWVYVAVPERQKRGAIHFHLAIRGFYHANSVRRLWLRAVGQRGGNVDITSPKKHGKRSWNPRRISQYLTKYLTKQETVAFNKRRYSSGGDIQIPPPSIAWMAYGLPMPLVLRDIIYTLSRQAPRTEWEAEGYFNITYAST